MRFAWLLLLIGLVPVQAQPPPIIDMHLHAHSLADYGGGAGVCLNDAPMAFPGVDPAKPITLEGVMVCERRVYPPA